MGGIGVSLDRLPEFDSADAAPRLRPEMASFRLLVLGFVRDYLDRHRVSPSQGEIRNGLRTTRTRVRDALRSLEKDGLIIRTPGKRGLSLPSLRDEAIRRLREMGFAVDEDIMQITRPRGPNSTLLPPASLDYVGPGLSLSQSGDQHGSESDRDEEEQGARREA